MSESLTDKHYDAVVLGGGMCGIGAAFVLANREKKVLLVERRSILGWEVTSAFQCNLETVDSPLVNRLRASLKSLGVMCNDRFDVPSFTLLLHHIITEVGIDVLLYSYPLRLIKKGNIIAGVVIGNKSGEQNVTANMFIDATEEALLWRQTDVVFLEKQSIPAREVIFFNNVDGGRRLQLPLSLGDTDRTKNIFLQSTIWNGEVCVEFDVFECSISTTRLALPEVIFLIRANVPQLERALLTHTGNEPFPLEVAAHLREKTLKHLHFKNLFAAGLWTIPEETKRQQVNRPAGRIRLGEETGLLASNSHSETPELGEVGGPSLMPKYHEADVVVCGGGTAGVVAAIAAAREGVKVILLEADTLLGGQGTGGGIHAYYFSHWLFIGGSVLRLGRVGFTPPSKRLEISKEIDEKVFEYYYKPFGGLQDEIDLRTAKVSGLLFEKGGYKCFGFHPEVKKLVLEQMCYEAGVDVVYATTVIGVEMDGKRRNIIRGVVTATAQGPVTYRGKVIIDSTGDADVAAKAGVPFIMGREADGIQHTFTQLGEYLEENGNMRLGGCPTDLGYVDASDVTDLTRARRLGLSYLYQHPQTRRLLYICPLLGLRECRQIIGDYQLTLTDQILGHHFDDCIGYMQAHHDNHSDDYENESDEAVLWVWLLGNWQRIIGCEVPYRSLLPRGVEGLLVACRGASMTIDAHYAFRMQPEMQQLGEAAGVAAALAVKLGVVPRAIDVQLVQDQLKKKGIINEGRRPKPLLTERSLPELKKMLLSDDPRDAVWLLAHYSGKEVLSLLSDVLRSGSPQSRLWAAVALAMHREKQAVPELLNCVEERRSEIPSGDKTVPLWHSAIVMLGRIGDSRAVPTLVKVLADKSVNFDVLLATVRTLGRIQNKSAISGLLHFLEREDLPQLEKLRRPQEEDTFWEIELAVAEALAKLGEPQPTITERYLNDPRSYVRRYASKISKLNNKIK